MRECIYVRTTATAADLIALLAALEPKDIDAFAAASLAELDRMGRIRRAFLAALGAPAESAGRAGVSPALEATVRKQGDMLEAVAEEVVALHALVRGMGDRILAQAELLAERAGRLVVADIEDVAPPPSADPDRPSEFEAARREWLAPQPAVAVLDDPEADLVPAPRPCPVCWDGGNPTRRDCPACNGTCDSTPVAGPQPQVVALPAGVSPSVAQAVLTSTEPSANGHAPKERSTSAGKRQKRLALARSLAAAPQRMSDLCRAVGMPDSTASVLLACDWFAKANGKYSPYTLTDAGREALRADGYVLVPTAPPEVESKPPEPETKPAEVETEPPPREIPAAPAEPVVLDPAARNKAQVRLICETIAAAADPLTADEIAHKAGLPVDVVVKKLNRYGPSAMGLRYFFKSEKHAGCWRLSNSGHELVQEGAVTG